MFSVPKPLPEPPSTSLHIGEHKSSTMTRTYPQHQSITSPLSSREKGDWGYKRPFPLKSTMATSTPLIRIKQVDSAENVTDFASAADHSLSLEKFQELRVAMSIPKSKDRNFPSSTRSDMWSKSVFEEDMDFTDLQRGHRDDKRWKFQGPWLARMTEGDFVDYVSKKVHPKRSQFRSLLKERLAADITTRRNQLAKEHGKPPSPKVEARDVTEEQFTEYLRSLRNDRVMLYSLVSKFLDLAPLGQPVGFVELVKSLNQEDSPYGKSGPPPSHPSAGISYLRTSSFMENHPVYGPQARRSPTLARVVYPRAGQAPAKLGVGGFVANVPSGDNEFNHRFNRGKTSNSKTVLNGIMHLDTTTYGGAKAYIEPRTASIDPSGKVVMQLRESHPEAQVIVKESKGLSNIYRDGRSKRDQPRQPSQPSENRIGNRRMEKIAEGLLEEKAPKA